MIGSSGVVICSSGVVIGSSGVVLRGGLGLLPGEIPPMKVGNDPMLPVNPIGTCTLSRLSVSMSLCFCLGELPVDEESQGSALACTRGIVWLKARR